MYGGIAKGSFGIARSDAVADIKAQFQFTDVDLQACASELFGVTKLSGRGNLKVSLAASGSSPFGLAPSLDGSATLIGHDGAIAGFNVEQLLKRLERRPLSGGGNLRSGSTPYDNPDRLGELQRRHRHRRGHPRRGPGGAPDLTGTASVPSREYDLKGVASLTPAANAASRIRTAVRGAGPVGRSPDLPRSGKPDPPLAGAAPLLDAVKDRKTRDAVRSSGSPAADGPAAGCGGAGGRSRQREGELFWRQPAPDKRSDIRVLALPTYR